MGTLPSQVWCVCGGGSESAPAHVRFTLLVLACKTTSCKQALRISLYPGTDIQGVSPLCYESVMNSVTYSHPSLAKGTWSWDERIRPRRSRGWSMGPLQSEPLLSRC